MYEIKYISECGTKFPNGYNLTDGGQGSGCKKGAKIKLDESLLTPQPTKVFMSLKKSDETKRLISERLCAALSSPEHRQEMMKNVQNQHKAQRFSRFKNVTIDETNKDQYIRIMFNKRTNREFVRIVIDKVETDFVGKYETTTELKERANAFIMELLNLQNTLLLETP
jgi:hypothetical protein